jgi:hypothetical protein
MLACFEPYAAVMGADRPRRAPEIFSILRSPIDSVLPSSRRAVSSPSCQGGDPERLHIGLDPGPQLAGVVRGQYRVVSL